MVYTHLKVREEQLRRVETRHERQFVIGMMADSVCISAFLPYAFVHCYTLEVARCFAAINVDENLVVRCGVEE